MVLRTGYLVPSTKFWPLLAFGLRPLKTWKWGFGITERAKSDYYINVTMDNDMLMMNVNVCMETGRGLERIGVEKILMRNLFLQPILHLT